MAPTRPISWTGETFRNEIRAAEGLVLVDFWADWCVPCHQIAPVLEELAERYASRVTIAKVNVDEEPELAARYGIRSIPSLLFFYQGAIVHRLSGVSPKAALEATIERLLRVARQSGAGQGAPEREATTAAASHAPGELSPWR